MNFETKLVAGTILNRYKRFLADIELASGEVITAHTANTGSMKTCWAPGWKVLISKSNNPKRKLPYSLEMTHNGKTWIGVNTSRPNHLVFDAIQSGQIPELAHYSMMQKEKTIGKSRLDIYLANDDEECFVEVKNVTLWGERDLALFPDAVSQRGLKHLEELMLIKESGRRAVMFYLVQREDVTSFSPAWEIDPDYSEALNKAFAMGVEILVYQCQLNEQGIHIHRRLPFEL